MKRAEVFTIILNKLLEVSTLRVQLVTRIASCN